MSSRAGSDERARATGGAPASSGPDAGADHGRAFLRELPVLVLLALVLAILIKTFLVQAFFIPSESMVPTLHVGDRVLVNRLAYRFGDIERFDVVVFSDPHPSSTEDRGVVGGFLHWLGEGTGVAEPAGEDFIKRVIALPGEVWEIRDGEVFVNGERLDEPYLSGPLTSATSDLRPCRPESSSSWATIGCTPATRGSSPTMTASVAGWDTFLRAT